MLAHAARPPRSRIRLLPRARRVILPLLLLALLLPLGCTDTPKRSGDPETDLRSQDSVVKMQAAQEAARRREPAAIPSLIELLMDDDPWVRFNAHAALIVIVGQKNFGYHYQGTAKERAAAQKRWSEWWEVSEELRNPGAAPGG